MNTVLLTLLAAAAVVIAALLLALRRSDHRIRRGNLARQRVARSGEARAEALVLRAGFEILERQPHVPWTMWVDGEPVDVAARPDLLLSRDGRTYVADVKTGALAPDPTRPQTRRQLLEYQRVLSPDGLLLIDVDAGRIVEVAFEEEAR